VTVFGSTLKSAATSPGVSRRSLVPSIVIYSLVPDGLCASVAETRELSHKRQLYPSIRNIPSEQSVKPQAVPGPRRQGHDEGNGAHNRRSSPPCCGSPGLIDRVGPRVGWSFRRWGADGALRGRRSARRLAAELPGKSPSRLCLGSLCMENVRARDRYRPICRATRRSLHIQSGPRHRLRVGSASLVGPRWPQCTTLVSPCARHCLTRCCGC